MIDKYQRNRELGVITGSVRMGVVVVWGSLELILSASDKGV
jgi:hypothetical protein